MASETRPAISVRVQQVAAGGVGAEQEIVLLDRRRIMVEPAGHRPIVPSTRGILEDVGAVEIAGDALVDRLGRR